MHIVPCRNFGAYREEWLRSQVGGVLSALGIEPGWEVEAIHFCREAPHQHAYQVWYHAVGELLSGAPAWQVDERGTVRAQSFEEISPRLWVGCHTDCAAVRDSFRGPPLIQVEFSALLPWVIDLPEPE
jgi:hypothetical protein